MTTRRPATQRDLLRHLDATRKEVVAGKITDLVIIAAGAGGTSSAVAESSDNGVNALISAAGAYVTGRNVELWALHQAGSRRKARKVQR